MEIVLGKYAGFCPGVKRAWGLVEKSTQEGRKPIFILGELIHNPQALAWLEGKGIKTIKNLGQLKSGTVIIRAHGEPLETYRQLAKFKSLTIVDATCPSVARVQKLAAKFEGEGFKVIVCGERDHPEAKATIGYTENGQIISSTFEAGKVRKTKKIAVLSQTTFSLPLFKEIRETLKRKAKDFKSLGTICNFTQLAQKEARQIARHVDLVIVVGGRQSSNTRRLTEVAKEVTPTHHVETAKEIKKPWFVGIKTVGLLAGASTPDWIIKEVEEKIKQA